MIYVTLVACAISIIILFVRAVKGPTPFDRVLAVNSIGTVIILSISLHGFAMGRPEFVDISILYAILNFLGTIAVLKLFKKSKVGSKRL